MSWSRRLFSSMSLRLCTPRTLVFVVDGVVLVVVIVVVFFFVAVGLLLRVGFFLVVEVVLFIGDLEFDRRVARHAQQGPALRARQLITHIDVILVDVNRRITLGTNRGHAGCSLAAEGVRYCGPNYNENLIASATNRARVYALVMTTTTSTRKTVAIATETTFVRDRFKAALEEAGHRAMIMKSVAQLLATVRADFDDLHLIVLDLRMPHASGVELVKRVRKLDGRKIPILLFSSSVTSVDEVRELASLGVSGYLNEYIATEHILPSIAPHLFPGTFHKREHPRVVMGIPVS